MLLKVVLAILLGMVSLWVVHSDDYINIIREDQDAFHLPKSECSNDIHNQCKSMGAVKEDIIEDIPDSNHCECRCIRNDKKNVFGFFDDKWKCESSFKIRNLVAKAQGCRVKSPLKPLDVVPAASGWSKFIQGAVSGPCELNEGFEALDCNGVWKEKQDARSSFRLEYVAVTGYSLKIDDDFDLHSSSIRGKVINIRISCTSSDLLTSKDFCVVLKVKGEQKCPISTTTEASPTTSSLTLPMTNSSSHQKENSPQPRKSNGGVIAGAIGGVVILLVLLVVLLIVVIKRRRKVSVDELPTSPDVDNPGYGRGLDLDRGFTIPTDQTDIEDQQLIYSYAKIIPVTLKDQDAKAVKASDLSKRDEAKKDAPIYNRLENPRGTGRRPNAKDEALYNVLAHDCTPQKKSHLTRENTDYARLENPKNPPQIEPSYHVLERPETKFMTSHEGTLYSVPTGTNSDGAAEYEALNEPNVYEAPKNNSLYNRAGECIEVTDEDGYIKPADVGVSNPHN